MWFIPKQEATRGKIIIYVTVAIVLLFSLEFFNIVDVPYFEIPDFFSQKIGMTEKTNQALGANQ